ncbi:hypothetical protein BJY04DRAFT_232884 [Aspergillus karnatakaensis]|uniref:uncharacterized protein n=1 Tax=Aspergillus karnatakaensis TaxID=1810916 RepID=UPI003CCD933A
MVYMHYLASRPVNSATNSPHFVFIVISPDRNTADTLYRILQSNQGRPLSVPTVSSGATTLTPQGIERLSPKLWVLQVKESPENVGSLGTAICPHTSHDADPAFDPVAGKMFLYSMGTYPDLGAKLLPGACDVDHDYISGYSFFVRRRGYPNTYWYCCGNLICLSTTKRSRFVISIADGSPAEQASSHTPMVHQDRVVIEWVDRDTRKRVGVVDNDWLAVKTTKATEFSFSDFQDRFYLGNEGTLDNPDPSRLGTTLDVVCWSSRELFQDSFELCYGIAPPDDR